MFRSCQIIIRELCSLLKLYYSINNSIRICKRGVVAAYHVVWECVLEQWLGVRRTRRNINYKSYCSTVHFRRITSFYQPTNAHIISHKTPLKRFKTLRHVSILSDHHQGALYLAKVILRYSQFNSYLQTRCCLQIRNTN